MKTTALSCMTAVAIIAPASAATILVNGYSYGSANPHPNYPDSGGELTDGISQTPVWPNTAVPGPLARWLNTNPSITFDFGSVVTVAQVDVWAADSNGSAGVALSDTITVRTPDSSFSRTFNITDPAGSGSVVKLELGGFQVSTDSLVIESTQSQQWTMLSEVRFDTAPEPSSALLCALGAIGLLRRRR